MCGINGCLHLKEFSYSLEEFSKATSTLNRRGPDSKGISEDILDRFVLKMGHQRLSILGIDETGNQSVDCPRRSNACHWMKQIAFGQFEVLDGEEAEKRSKEKVDRSNHPYQVGQDLGLPVFLVQVFLQLLEWGLGQLC